MAGALMFLGHEGRIALTSLGNYLMLSAAQRMGLRLRVGLLRHLNTLSAEYFEDTPVGSVMYPLKEPIEEIAYFGSDLLPAILRMLLTAGFTLIAMCVLSPALTLAILPLIPAFLVTRHYFRKKLATDSDKMQSDRLVWSSFLEEHLSSAIPIQLLGQEKRQERRAFRSLARAVRSQQNLYKTGSRFTIWSSLAVVLAMCTVIAYGGERVLTGTLSIGSLVAFYGFVTQLFDPLSGAAELYARSQKTFASIRQVQSAFALSPRVTDSRAAVPLSKDHPARIDLADVHFGYSRRADLLHIPSLCILPGEHVAIAGENGAGKSTLVKLIARIYDPNSGSVLVGGEDIRNILLKSLRQNVCYLPRDPALFEGTIASNLRFVSPAALDHELEEAIRVVELSALIASLPNGIRQRIGPGGCQLSGGERQRLAIARALLRRPRVLILDEATSCLDPSAEAIVLQKLQEIGGWTLIVVSHRPSTFQLFGRILVLSAGRIVEDGRLASSAAEKGIDSSEFVSRPFNVGNQEGAALVLQVNPQADTRSSAWRS
jgi:ABC-type multidrug transport system fused ATPase/permease subunit